MLGCSAAVLGTACFPCATSRAISVTRCTHPITATSLPVFALGPAGRIRILVEIPALLMVFRVIMEDPIISSAAACELPGSPLSWPRKRTLGSM